jgi:RNA polymerase-binding transcription factor DksA
MTDPIDRNEIRTLIRERLATLEPRLGRIQSDRRREQGPLDADSEEQAVELENAPVLDVLDAVGHDELEELRAALARLDADEFGTCQKCGYAISMERLRAVPSARTCRSCAA